MRPVPATLSEGIFLCFLPVELPFRAPSASLPDATTSQELVITLTPFGRTAGAAALAVLLTTACAAHASDEPWFSTKNDQGAAPWKPAGRVAGVPDTQIQIPEDETVLTIKSGAGSATAPVVLPPVPAIVLYARCSGGTRPLELRDGSQQTIVIPCGPAQVRREFAAGPVSVIGDPSTRWTLVATRPG